MFMAESWRQEPPLEWLSLAEPTLRCSPVLSGLDRLTVALSPPAPDAKRAILPSQLPFLRLPRSRVRAPRKHTGI